MILWDSLRPLRHGEGAARRSGRAERACWIVRRRRPPSRAARLPSLQKLKSILIRLVSSAGSGYFYATKKNPTTVQHKIAFMKVRVPHVIVPHSLAAPRRARDDDAPPPTPVRSSTPSSANTCCSRRRRCPRVAAGDALASEALGRHAQLAARPLRTAGCGALLSAWMTCVC